MCERCESKQSDCVTCQTKSISLALRADAIDVNLYVCAWQVYDIAYLLMWLYTAQVPEDFIQIVDRVADH